MSLQYIHRHTGGLEKQKGILTWIVYIHRHTGGLENSQYII